MLFQISKNLGKSSMTHILLAEEQTTKRFARINPREKFTDSQFAKLNPHEMLKKLTRENKFTRKFLSLRYIEKTYYTYYY